MHRYIPPSERQVFHFGNKISTAGILISVVLMFSLVSLISAVQTSFASSKKPKTATEKTVNQANSIVSGEIVGKRTTSQQLEQVKLASAPLILQNLPLERNWPLVGMLTTYYSSYHPAIDIASHPGTPIHSFASGVVTSAGWQGSFGYAITIVHNNGYATTYAHLSKILISVGDQVDTNSVIGLVGSTGRSTGPHLHFQLTLNGRTVNPLSALP